MNLFNIDNETILEEEFFCFDWKKYRDIAVYIKILPLMLND